MERELLEGCAMLAPRLRRRSQRGFTLVELGAVIVIVGILAVIAVVGYRKYILSAKVSEAQTTISAIRIAQEDYRAERGTYANPVNWCPSDGSNAATAKYQWSSTCAGWTALPVHVDGMVAFGYRTAGGPSGFADPFGLAFVNWGAASGTVPWYVVEARADLDGNGAPFTRLAGSSFTNQIFIADEGN